MEIKRSGSQVAEPGAQSFVMSKTRFCATVVVTRSEISARRRPVWEVTMSITRMAVAVVLLALMSAGASAQVGIRIGGVGIGLGLQTPPLFGGRERSDRVERYRAPQRSDRVQRKRNNDDDDVKTAKKTPASEE